jgi:hypothetical protein
MKTVLAILLPASVGGQAFIGTLARNTLLTSIFFTLAGFAVLWGIFIQMGPAMIAIYQRRRTKLTPQQLAMEMAAQSDLQLLDKFPKQFDMSDEQQRELFPSALAMFPDGFQRSLEALDAARIELQKRNTPIPQVPFQSFRFMELKENRDLTRVLKWCVVIALLSVPMSLRLIHQYHHAVVHGESYLTTNLAAIFIRIAAPILAITSSLGVVVIPWVLLIQYTIFCHRRRKLASLSEAICGFSTGLDDPTSLRVNNCGPRVCADGD